MFKQEQEYAIPNLHRPCARRETWQPAGSDDLPTLSERIGTRKTNQRNLADLPHDRPPGQEVAMQAVAHAVFPRQIVRRGRETQTRNGAAQSRVRLRRAIASRPTVAPHGG